MGYTVIRLDENSITTSVLQNLDAVIAAVRAYDVHDWLADKYNILMEYVKNGGNLIVQYNRNQGVDSTNIVLSHLVFPMAGLQKKTPL